MSEILKFWIEVFQDLDSFLFLSSPESVKHPVIVLIIISYLSCFISLVISWGIYWRVDINLLNVKEFKISDIALESLFPILVNMLLYVAKVVSFTPLSVFFFSVFWIKAFLQFVGNQKKDSDAALREFNKKAEPSQ